jgi:hypothetical protein
LILKQKLFFNSFLGKYQKVVDRSALVSSMQKRQKEPTEHLADGEYALFFRLKRRLPAFWLLGLKSRGNLK